MTGFVYPQKVKKYCMKMNVLVWRISSMLTKTRLLLYGLLSILVKFLSKIQIIKNIMPKIESAGVPVPVAPVVDPFDVPISEETRIFRKYGLKPRAQAEKYTPPKNTDPHYLPGQIVYLIPNPARTPNEHNPFIGSPYEIDCKVLSTYKIAGELNYHLVSGIGATFEATHDFLTSPKNKGKYKTNEFFTLNEDIGICNKGINFNRVGEYYSNDYHGIFIHHSRFDQIIHLFTKHLINE